MPDSTHDEHLYFDNEGNRLYSRFSDSTIGEESDEERRLNQERMKTWDKLTANERPANRAPSPTEEPAPPSSSPAPEKDKALPPTPPSSSPASERGIALLKFMAQKRWVPVVIGALVGFAAGGPAGAVIGAGLGLLASEAARQVLSFRERQQESLSGADAVAGQKAGRPQRDSSQSTPHGGRINSSTAQMKNGNSFRRVDPLARREAPAAIDLTGGRVAQAAAIGTDKDRVPRVSGNEGAAARPSGEAPANPQQTISSNAGRRASR
ncbi:hypothetical protein ACIBQ5_33620 [Streptomyces massasporeus]|uniref:hypothetical protein n=1 Tax=Streptomyces massasporeus TaxID=67324 RepID=UPI0037A083B5